MHCPTCGQLQVSDETRFCSRCGLLLTGIAQVMVNGGVLPTIHPNSETAVSTPRKRGMKQGLFIFLLAFLIVPIITILTIAANAEPYVVVLSAILLGAGAMLRVAYALMFESNLPAVQQAPVGGRFSPHDTEAALPPPQSIPASAYTSPAGSWRDTADLQEHPSSITDSTTKLLQKERDAQ
ncbi:MAG TPA: hypothetical protein VK468_08920 [Pyrinomonadaceae bacterium]|nr:hypothetical protein [Pyrinomonadaceae bacterium]